jgi:hypothetical protein
MPARCIAWAEHEHPSNTNGRRSCTASLRPWRTFAFSSWALPPGRSRVDGGHRRLSSRSHRHGGAPQPVPLLWGSPGLEDERNGLPAHRLPPRPGAAQHNPYDQPVKPLAGGGEVTSISLTKRKPEWRQLYDDRQQRHALIASAQCPSTKALMSDVRWL